MTISKVTISMILAVVAMIGLMADECQGFSPTMMPRSAAHFPQPFAVPRTSSSSLRWRNFHPSSNQRWTTTTRLAAISDEAAFLSDDPFVILGLDTPTADKKILKRAFKKRALKFHPDVVTDIHSSPEEKKKASDRFAKINGAYAQLMGKGKGNGSSSSSSSSSTSGSSSGWTPPHRRTSSYKTDSTRSTEGASTDWRDYMPDYRKDNDADYDTGGDSFGQIFSDMFTGAAAAAVSGGVGGVGGGIFNEFLEFLEGGSSASGFAGSGGSNDDADLRTFLQTASLEEVSEEMDDTAMVVTQLETKSRNLDDEIFAMDAEARMASKFSEKIALEEKTAELKARKEVVGGYLDRARNRLLKLQTHYKDNMSYGSGRESRRSSSSSWQDVQDEASTYSDRRSSYSSSSSSSSSYGSSSSSSSYGSTRSTTETPGATEASSSTDGDEDSWKYEGFGSSSGRGRRGSGRRRARSRSGVDSNPPAPRPAPSPPPPSYSTERTSSTRSESTSSSRRQSTTTPSPSPSSSSSSVTRSNYSYDVPPHRRTSGSSSFASRQQEDKKRMQEIKVDEEFEKLKKELG
eukprot:CAMPEP_0116141980 /NCGR_PEP_ID=MMETSP0329-20121206/14664_1 /TAXON_ID=697910 /ORGANISM="Pseudo-nitzschia arenysensis, Strain B593" /LENGTH=573 /DNA_ID=CAMNT_0003637185 /DNA_START=332 /DNA_END=2050 /DNA_ORIENTATION=+